MEFTFEELADIHLTYGEMLCNATAARRRYAEKFPLRRLPSVPTFLAIDHRARNTGRLCSNHHTAGRPRLVNVEADVLHEIHENPRASIRRISATLDVPPSSVGLILSRNNLHPYHFQPVQSLIPPDCPDRLQYSRWFLQQCAINPLFNASILFTDEATFTQDGVFNYHNEHFWANENPHVIRESNFQHRFAINVWAGIVGDHLIGPHILPQRLTGALYLHFLQEDLPQLLEDIPIAERLRMWFMHDGAPAHFSHVVRNHLNLTQPNRWIGRGGPIKWPPRSPDLNPLDFYLWGALKASVYATQITSAVQLRQRVQAACEEIKISPGLFERVRQSSYRRTQACVMAEGSHFEQYL